MTMKRTVAVAGLASAVLIGASSSFALTSGLFGGRRADQVGSFRPVEMRLTPITDAAGKSPVVKAVPVTSPGPAASVASRAVQDVTDGSGGSPAPIPSTPGPNPSPGPAVGATPGDESGSDANLDGPDEGANHETEVDDGHEDVEEHDGQAPEDEHEAEEDDHGRSDDD
jgi:hypothetical protein